MSLRQWLQSLSNELQSDEDIIRENVLNVKELKERYRHLRAIRHGYKGLCLFLLFMCSYVACLGMQHRLSTIGEVNVSFQILIDSLKTDATTRDMASYYNALVSKVVPTLLGDSWDAPAERGSEFHGRITNEFYHIIGGLMITAKKTHFTNCFRGRACYTESPVTDPFFVIKLPGNAGNFSVPYDAALEGYTINLPSSTTPEETSQLLHACRGLFGQDTREIWVAAVAFNPSGYKTVTSVRYGAKISILNNIDFYTSLTTVPYHVYCPHSVMFQIACEVCLVIFAAYSFVRPLLLYSLCEPHLQLDRVADSEEYLTMRTKWLDWVSSWQHLPVKGGQLLWKVPAALYTTMFVSVVCWILLCMQYTEMDSFYGDHMDSLFLNPLGEHHGDLKAMLTASLDHMHAGALRINLLVERISDAYNRYFLLHVIVMTLMVIRLNEYFAFQKRLSMVADTFSGIFDDLLHMGAVLIIICFFFGVLNCLAFGAYDRSFQNIFHSFFEMILVCFGLFKPAAATPYVQSLSKYSPHVIQHVNYLSWLPLVLQILFKVVVVLLLFKLLMGVIMESYKKHARLRQGSSPVREDIQQLMLQAYHYVWGHLICGRPWRSTDKPWERHFWGLDNPERIKGALNSVFLPGTNERVRAVVKHEQCIECHDTELAFVLRVYGTNRKRAEALFKGYWREHEQKALEKAKDTSSEKSKDSEKEKSKCKDKEKGAAKDDEANIEQSLDQAMKSLRHAQVRSGFYSGSDNSNVFEDLSREKIQDVFDEYDFLNIGTVDHRLMPQLFQQLGFRIRDFDLAGLLADYDHNEDGDTSFKEFDAMLRDDRLVGHYQKKPKVSKNWRYLRHHMNGLFRTATVAKLRIAASDACLDEEQAAQAVSHGLPSSVSATTPLLDSHEIEDNSRPCVVNLD